MGITAVGYDGSTNVGPVNGICTLNFLGRRTTFRWCMCGGGGFSAVDWSHLVC